MANKHLRSNAIALVRALPNGDFQLVGAGMGSLIAWIRSGALAGPRAREKAGGRMEELVLISDDFFHLRDGVEAAQAWACATWCSRAGASRDEEVIAAGPIA